MIHLFAESSSSSSPLDSSQSSSLLEIDTSFLTLLIREECCDEEIHKKNNLPEGDVGQTKDGSVS